MSAIAGILQRDGRPVDRDDLARMVETLAPWGPDACGLWHSGPAALGQLTLATTPESRFDKRPHGEGDEAQVLVADARIDNRDELIAALSLDAGDAAEMGDGELILRAYQRWGEACPERLIGDFAFAIWDGKRGSLFCARDHLGVRPLYYHLSEGLFCFATQIRALLTLSAVPRRLNEEVLADYLALLPPNKAKTFYLDIFKLPPGHSLLVTRDGAKQRCYWKLDPSRELRLGSDAEYAEAFKHLFTEAVRCRLRSSGPVAAMLSGGLDSSSIVCTARGLLDPGQRMITLSGVFPSFRSPEFRVDEASYIDLVVAGGGIDARYVQADDSSPIFDFLWRGEEPIPAAALYMDWSIFKAAKAQGLRVLLSGNDGDSVVGYGYGYLAELAWRGRWRALLEELYDLSRRLGVGRRDLMRHYVLNTLLPYGVRSAWGRMRKNGAPVYDRRSVIRPEFADRTGVRERTRRFLWDERPARVERQAHHDSVGSSLLTLLLELFSRGAGAFGLEPRYPFFDRRLVEFCLALPGHQKLHQGFNRVVMRRAMTGMLPAEIQWRRDKQNLNPNFNVRLLDNRKLLDEVVLGAPRLIEEYVDVAALRETYRRYLEKPERRTRDSFTVFWAVTILLWLRESGLAP